MLFDRQRLRKTSVSLHLTFSSLLPRFHWKSFVSFTKLPRLQSEQKKKQHLAVANQLIRHANVKAAANIKVKATAKYKVPVSKEVEIINKWRELDQADRELAKTRGKHMVPGLRFLAVHGVDHMLIR